MRHTFKAALLAVTALASPAYAQEADIVVTATRTPTPTNRLPARIDIIHPRSDDTLSGALGGEAVQGGGPGQQSSLFLRGTNSKHTLALFDGIRLNDPASPNAAYDFGIDTLGGLERIEVLRGPASSIYGADAIGGVVNLIPRRGGETAFEPFLELSAGSFDTRRVLLGAAGGGEGGFSYGVSAESFRTDGYDATPERMATHTGDPDGATIETLTASARQTFGQFAIDALVRTRTSTAEYDTFSGGVFFDLRADDPDLENEAEQTLWRIGADWTGERFDIRLSGGRVVTDRNETDGGFQTSMTDAEHTFADLTASYRLGAGVITGGVAFQRNAIDTQPQFASPLSVEEDQVGGYLIGQFDLAPWLSATGSVRVDEYDGFGAQTTYTLGAVATFGQGRLYASYGTAFKAPSLSERFETSFFNIGNPDLAPEESESWEVGFDWAPTDAFSASVSYYQTSIDDLIEYNFGLLQNINVGRAEIEGAEAFVELEITPWARLHGEYAWTDARNGITGAPLTRRPEHTWSVEALFQPTARLALSARWTYVGERTDVTYDNGGNFLSSNRRVDAFQTGALAATYELDAGAQVFVRINNITDETYEQPAAFSGAPRNGMIGLRAQF